MATDALRAHGAAHSFWHFYRRSPQPNPVLLDEATEQLIHELRGSAGDLWDLVDAVRWRPLHVVDISAEQIVRWRTDDARSWQLVLDWLTRMDVEVNLR